MPLLSKEQILQADDRKRLVVEVPEWGGEVILATMTGTDRDALEQWTTTNKGDWRGIRARLLSVCLIDESGRRLFSDAEVEALGAKNGAVIDRLCTLAKEVNRLSDQDLEQMGKASAPGQNGDSGSV